jgi:hypothetical protein
MTGECQDYNSIEQCSMVPMSPTRTRLFWHWFEYQNGYKMPRTSWTSSIDFYVTTVIYKSAPRIYTFNVLLRSPLHSGHSFFPLLVNHLCKQYEWNTFLQVLHLLAGSFPSSPTKL